MKKKLLANTLFSLGIPFFYKTLIRLRPIQLSILAYHRIYSPPTDTYPFSDGAISAYPEEFDKQMEVVSNKYNVINFRVLKEIQDAGERLPDNSLIITFDDGYADNYEIALPILQKYNLTATVFVSTGYIGTNTPFWFEKFAYLMKKVPCGPIAISLSSLNHTFEITESSRKEISKKIMLQLKSMPNADRIASLNELDNLFNIHLPADEIEMIKTLTWDQVIKLDKAGIEIGSHTVSHPILSSLNDSEIYKELATSKAQLDENLGKETVSICYPVGGPQYYDDRVKKAAKELGYQYGISYRHGVIKDMARQSPFDFPRIHVETEINMPHFIANLLIPEVFL